MKNNGVNMSRQARYSTEYLHLIVRGIGKQLLFEEKSDYEFYLNRLKTYCIETNVKVICYCLMENHVHLLVFDPENQVSLFMKKIGVSYAAYFNKKYERTGHLFQDRYKSECIKDDAQLLVTFRYILNNPVKAGISTAADYPWSSYLEYGMPNPFTFYSRIYEMVGDSSKLNDYLLQGLDDECMEFNSLKHDDTWALDIIHKTMNLKSGTNLQNLPREDRNNLIIKLKKAGLSKSQIERLTGIPKAIIDQIR